MIPFNPAGAERSHGLLIDKVIDSSNRMRRAHRQVFTLAGGITTASHGGNPGVSLPVFPTFAFKG